MSNFRWKADIRASGAYDSDNPRDWHNFTGMTEYCELRPDYIQSMWDSAKNKIFVGNRPLDYTGDIDVAADILETDGTAASLTAKELIVYSPARVASQLRKIYKYFKKLMG